MHEFNLKKSCKQKFCEAIGGVLVQESVRSQVISGFCIINESSRSLF